MYKKIILMLLFVFIVGREAVFAVSTADSLALVALYNSTDGDGWDENENWLDGPVSTWYGVTVDNGRVTELDLDYNDLDGSIPSEIGNLTDLINLYLSENDLSGSIPSEIGNLTKLNRLFLSGNYLTGSIPSSIGNLTQMWYLEFFDNNLSGSIPPEIGNLTELRWLCLNGNDLSGSIPSEIGNLTALNKLQLNDNELTGSIPSSIGDIPGLNWLLLQENQFTGSVPSQIGNLEYLKNFYVYDNDLADLPPISGSSYLEILEIQGNKFTFEDIEPNIGLPGDEFAYSPQDNVGEPLDTTIIGGSSFTMSVSVGGSNNLYQWKKDGTAVPGATGSSYTISSAILADSGSYICEITNTVATDLTLYSFPVNLDVIEVITVTSPNGGENWYTGNDYNIIWTSGGGSGHVKIEYSTDNGSAWAEVVASIPDTGVCSWTIPDTSSSNCLVRVSDTDGDPFDLSDASFTISNAPSVTIESPNGGEKLIIDSTYNIIWMSNVVSGEVRVEYSTNNGSSWMEIIASMPDTGICSWVVPDTTSDSCLVRVSDTDGDPTDVSNAVFSILPASAIPFTRLPEEYSMNVKGITADKKLKLGYTLPERSDIKFSVYDITGKIVSEISKEEPAGFYSERINMAGIPTGVYFIRMEVNGAELIGTDKFVFVK